MGQRVPGEGQGSTEVTRWGQVGQDSEAAAGERVGGGREMRVREGLGRSAGADIPCSLGSLGKRNTRVMSLWAWSSFCGWRGCLICSLG